MVRVLDSSSQSSWNLLILNQLSDARQRRLAAQGKLRCSRTNLTSDFIVRRFDFNMLTSHREQGSSSKRISCQNFYMNRVSSSFIFSAIFRSLSWFLSPSVLIISSKSKTSLPLKDRYWLLLYLSSSYLNRLESIPWTHRKVIDFFLFSSTLFNILSQLSQTTCMIFRCRSTFFSRFLLNISKVNFKLQVRCRWTHVEHARFLQWYDQKLQFLSTHTISIVWPSGHLLPHSQNLHFQKYFQNCGLTSVLSFSFWISYSALVLTAYRCRFFLIKSAYLCFLWQAMKNYYLLSLCVAEGVFGAYFVCPNGLYSYQRPLCSSLLFPLALSVINFSVLLGFRYIFRAWHYNSLDQTSEISSSRLSSLRCSNYELVLSLGKASWMGFSTSVGSPFCIVSSVIAVFVMSWQSLLDFQFYFRSGSSPLLSQLPSEGMELSSSRLVYQTSSQVDS